MGGREELERWLRLRGRGAKGRLAKRLGKWDRGAGKAQTKRINQWLKEGGDKPDAETRHHLELATSIDFADPPNLVSPVLAEAWDTVEAEWLTDLRAKVAAARERDRESERRRSLQAFERAVEDVQRAVAGASTLVLPPHTAELQEAISAAVDTARAALVGGCAEREDASVSCCEPVSVSVWG